MDYKIPENYCGCQNCVRQPEPMMRCELQFTAVMPVCPYWKLKQNKRESK